MKLQHSCRQITAFLVITCLSLLFCQNITAQKFGIAAYGNSASPTSDFFKDEFKSGYGIGVEVIKNFQKEGKLSPLSLFGLFQYSSFDAVEEEDEFFSSFTRDPLAVVSFGAGFRYTHRMDIFRLFGDLGLSLSASSAMISHSEYVNGRLTESQELGSDGMIFGVIASAGVGISLVDFRIRYFGHSNNVSYLAYCVGLTVLIK
jgi:hypothetical protein